MADETQLNAPGADAVSARALQAIEARADSYDQAALNARKPLLDAVDKKQGVSERIREQLEAIRAPVTPYTSAQSKQWAEVDARDYRKIKDPQQQYDAALRIGDNLRQDQEYRVALHANAPDISERAQTVYSGEQNRFVSKDARKRTEFQMMAADEAQARRLPAADADRAGPEARRNGNSHN